MRPDVREDFDWGRGFIPHMREIVADNLIGEAPPAEDMQRNTDLIVLKLDAVRIACRVRRAKYAISYGDEFTIRQRRSTGVSELSKLLAGWGDYMIYGFAPPGDEGPRMARWLLADLSVFRVWFSRALLTLPEGQMPGTGKANGDGSSSFRAFALSAMPENFVRACSWDAVEAAA